MSTMLRDGLLVSKLAMSASIPTWRSVDGDVAGQALGLIEQRVAEARAGMVRLNRPSDAEFFEKQAGITPYALEASPLVAIFMRPAAEENEP